MSDRLARLVLVHGINQQGKDPAELRREWVEDLEKGIGRAGALAEVEVLMPFYGDELVRAMSLRPDGAIAQGPSATDDAELADFLARGLQEQAQAAGITSSQIIDEQELQHRVMPGTVAVEQGFPMSRRINAIVSLLERISPWRGNLAVRLLGQAYQYLRKPHVTSVVDSAVVPSLTGGTAVVVAHSLGTVVTFKLLRQLAGEGSPTTVPLYVTCGSPLTLATVQDALGPPFDTPAGIGRWLNVRDRDDFISLDRSLGRPRFPGPIENRWDLKNPGKDPHAIPGYLSFAPLAQDVAKSLGVIG